MSGHPPWQGGNARGSLRRVAPRSLTRKTAKLLTNSMTWRCRHRWSAICNNSLKGVASRQPLVTELIMHTERIYPQHDVPHIPMRHLSWFNQLLMVLAVLIVAGVVYGFWQTAAIPLSPTEPVQSLPAQGLENPRPPPTNEDSETGSRTR
jgi:hypothetical protein